MHPKGIGRKVWDGIFPLDREITGKHCAKLMRNGATIDEAIKEAEDAVEFYILSNCPSRRGEYFRKLAPFFSDNTVTKPLRNAMQAIFRTAHLFPFELENETNLRRVFLNRTWHAKVGYCLISGIAPSKNDEYQVFQGDIILESWIPMMAELGPIWSECVINEAKIEAAKRREQTSKIRQIDWSDADLF